MNKIIDNQLLPPNLMRLGVKRQGDGKAADLVTIYRTPYPVLSNYVTWCQLVGLDVFAGGTYKKQGAADRPGHIGSGYRDYVIGSNDNSPHFYAFALDPAVGAAARQVDVAPPALGLFTRIGLYPFRGFIHLDQAPMNWIIRYNKRLFWVQDAARRYIYFDALDDAVSHVKVICGL